MKDLLKIARKKYKPGTKYICLVLYVSEVVLDEDEIVKKNNGIFIKRNHKYISKIQEDENWAPIIKKINET